MITAPTPRSYDWFGTAVSISDNYMAVGANGVDQAVEDWGDSRRGGAVYI